MFTEQVKKRNLIEIMPRKSKYYHPVTWKVDFHKSLNLSREADNYFSRFAELNVK